MLAVSSTSGPSQVHYQSPLSVESVAPRESLLTPPTSLDEAAAGDALTMLYALKSKQSHNETKVQESSANATHHDRESALASLHDALERAAKSDDGPGFFECIGDFIENLAKNSLTLNIEGLIHDADTDLTRMDNSPQFWKDLLCGATKVAEVAGIVAGLAGAVVTGGASIAGVLAIASVICSTAAVANQELHIVGGNVGEKLTLALSVASAVFGAGSAVATCVSKGAENAAAAGAKAALARVSASISAAQGIAMGVQGVATANVAAFHAEGMDAQADAERARAMTKRATKQEEGIVAELRSIAQHHQKALDSVIATLTTQQQTSADFAQAIRG